MDSLTCLLIDRGRNAKNEVTKALKQYDLTCRQAVVLCALDGVERSAKDIGALCSMDKATLSSILNKLCDSSSVCYRENAQDKREKLYRLTEHGHALLPYIRSVENACRRRLAVALTDDEAEMLMHLLKKVYTTQ